MTPQELWNLNPTDFNKWRRENDLKNLFKIFQQTLPKFDTWLDTNKLSVDIILETNQPGQFFYGDNEVALIKFPEKHPFFITIEDEKHKQNIIDLSASDGSELSIFKPYFDWAKITLKTTKIIKTKFSGDLDTFRYVGGTAQDVPDMSSAIIAPGATVLKLGGVKIDGWVKLNDRNLDFTNLDFLEINGKATWHTEKNIFYCTCRNISLNNVDSSATKFYGCHFENLNVHNSTLYWIEFWDCDIFKALFDNSRLTNLIIERGSINRLSFNRVEVENIFYTPPEKEWHCGHVSTYETVRDNYKRFRVLYQSNGLREEASDAYYKERLFELKYNWEGLLLIDSIKKIGKTSWNHLSAVLKFNFKKLITVIGQVLSYLIWGFGERPKNIFFASLFLMTTYAILYRCFLIKKTVDAIYLSVIIFSTLGFGDYAPIQNSTLKLIVASEALIGAFFLGLFVAGYANKAKY